MRAALAVVSVALVLAAPAAADEWTGYGGDPARQGNQVSDTLAPPLQRAWSIDLPSPGTNPQFSSPVIVGGRVFVTGWRFAATAAAYGLDLATGSRLWGPVDIGGSGHWSGLTYDNGTLFTVSDDGTVTALAPASGQVLWQTPLGSPVDADPVAVNGQLYVVTSASLVALTEASGALLWQRAIVDGTHASPAVANGNVFLSGVGRQAYAFDANGNQLWRHDTGFAGAGGKATAVHNGLVYIRDDNGDQPIMLDAASGATRGSFMAQTLPAFSGSTMYVISQGVLSAENATTGATLWTFTQDTGMTYAPIVVNNVLYAGSFAGQLYALDPATGGVLWQENVGANLPAPDEHNATAPLTGFGAAEGYLVLPVWYQGSGSRFELIAYRSSASAPPPPTEPETSITSGPPGATTDTAATFTFTSTASGSSFSCTLDGGPPTPCSTPTTLSSLAEGSHSFTVAATDPAGRTDPTPATWSWTVQAPPDTSITSGPPSSTTSTSAAFTFTSTGQGATFACSLDGATASSCSSPITYTGLAVGSHTFSVASSQGSATDPTPATAAWTIAQPAGVRNDMFADAQLISGTAGSATAATTGATHETGEPYNGGIQGGHSTWFRWTPTVSGTATVDTFGSNFDTTLGAYTGSTVAALTARAANDDANGGTTSSISFLVTAGTTYSFSVDGYSTATGNVHLDWSVTGSGGSTAPPNDLFASAQPITGSSGQATGTSLGATKEPGEPNHAGNSGGHSVWYRWTAPTTGTATVDLAGSAFDTLLGIYTGSRVSALTRIAANDDANSTTLASLTRFKAQAGATYLIAVDGYGGATGSLTIRWHY